MFNRNEDQHLGRIGASQCSLGVGLISVSIWNFINLAMDFERLGILFEEDNVRQDRFVLFSRYM